MVVPSAIWPLLLRRGAVLQSDTCLLLRSGSVTALCHLLSFVGEGGESEEAGREEL